MPTLATSQGVHTRGGFILVKPYFPALVSTFENRGQQCVHEVVKKKKSNDA